MLPSRFASSGPSSAMRKSRLEGKPSLLPKPRLPGSTDRLSNEARRPSTSGHRSSSAEPRSTFGGGRQSREASATKLPINARSRSHTADHRYGQTSMTPLRNSVYHRPTVTPQRSRSQTADQRYGQTSMTPLRNSVYHRPTVTPQRTPSEDRSSRSWQTSLDRALAFCTVKDQRPISTVAWQRAVYTRVQEELTARGAGGEGAAIVRPLTITRFVDIVGGLLNCLTQDAKLTNDNYVTRLPNLSKRFLYPGVVSKSWLKTVNTLHAFPQALALIAYFLDLVKHIEEPASYEWMYPEKDELACLKRDYLYKCWIRFQEPGHQFEDINEEYLQSLRALLGSHDDKIAELQQTVQNYQHCLEDEAEVAARAHEDGVAARRDELCAALRDLRTRMRQAVAHKQAAETMRGDLIEETKAVEAELEPAMAECQKLKLEIEKQTLSVAERAKLQDDIYYAMRVVESKHSLAEQIDKMVQNLELQLALWQQKTLASCVQYRQGLIRQSAEIPRLASLAVDETSLMDAECSTALTSALAALRGVAADLQAQRTAQSRNKTALQRQRAAQAEELRAKIPDLKSTLSREQQALDWSLAAEGSDAALFASEQAERAARLQALTGSQAERDTLQTEQGFWENQHANWRSKLSGMQTYIAEEKVRTKRLLEEAKAKRAKLLLATLAQWTLKLEPAQNNI